jgi:hypothetical protein
MRLALNMAQMVKRGFLQAAIEETKYLIKKPCAEVREEKNWGVEFPGHNTVKAAMDIRPAIFRQNHTAGCLPCHNGTRMNRETRWRHKGTGVPPPNQHRPTPDPTPDPMSPQHCTPQASTSNTCGVQPLEIINLLAGYPYSHTSLPCVQSFALNASAQDSQDDTDFDTNLLTDEETATG